MISSILRYYLVYITVIAVSIVNAQDDPSFNYTVDDGLPSDQVYSVYQDKNGLMWFATDRGIASYNGSYFKSYGLFDGLDDDVVFGFYPQDDGMIYCSTMSNQIFYFHPDSLVIHPYKFNKILKEIPPSQMRSIQIENGKLRCRFLNLTGFIEITNFGKLIKHELDFRRLKRVYNIRQKNNFAYSSQTLDKEAYLFDPVYRQVFSIKDSIICTNMRYGVGFILKDSIIKRIYLYNDSILLSSDIGNTKDGFWVAAVDGNGLQLYSKDGNKIKTYLPNKMPTCYLKTKDGVWITTLYSGVYFFPNRMMNGLKKTLGKMVYSLSGDGKNGLIVGLYEKKLIHFNRSLNCIGVIETQGEGISEYDHSKGRVLDNRLSSRLNYSLKISDNNSKPLLLVTGYNIYNWKRGFVLKLPHPKLVYDTEFLGDNIIYASSEGLHIVDSESNIILTRKINVRIVDLDVVKGKVYLATKGKGLIILDNNLEIIEHITSENGLISNYLNEVLCMKDGTIWVGGRGGVNVIKNKGKNRRIYKITTNNGLLHPEVRDIIVLNNKVFIGTRKGVNYFDLKDFYDIIRLNVNVKLSLLSIEVDGEELIDFHSLRHYQNNILFNYEFAAFIPHADLKFRYRLLRQGNNDSSWLTTKDRSIRFTSLQEGKYVFEIQSLVDGEPRGDKIIQHFTIYPAFYKTWWFNLGVLLFLSVIIWLFFKYRILNYNREIIREILRQLLKRLKPKGKYFIVRSNGKDIRIDSGNILYVESSGNYIHIYTISEKIIVREKLSNFFELVPDPLEYIQLRRSLIIRIDCISAKSIDTVTVNGVEFKVGNTYLSELKKIEF